MSLIRQTLTALILFSSACALTWAGPYTVGDVFLSLRNGTVQEYTPTGTLVQTLVTGRGGELTGSAFDSAGNFYVTAGFTGGDVVNFDSNGNLLGTFGTGYSGHPESILFDKSGNVWVGQADSTQIVYMSATGLLIDSFTLGVQDRGTDWIDLAADQTTMFYTSEGSSVKRFDVGANTQLADFSNVGGTQYAFRLLPDGGLLVANTANALRLDSSGAIVQTYLPGSNLLFALNLDPDAQSFWTAEYRTGDVFNVDYTTGATLHHFNIGAGISGLSVLGEITEGGPPPTVPGVPEPASIFLLGGGLLALGLRKRIRA